MTWALLLALSLPAAARTPQATVDRVMARAAELVAAQKGEDARTIRDLDRKAENLSKTLKPLGWKAVPALAAAAQDLKRPPKVRLFAVSFLALVRDPAAFPPLEDILLDEEQPEFVRSLAAQSLPAQGAPSSEVSRALCKALTQENLAPNILSDIFISLSNLGCPDPAALARIARAYGPRPGAKELVVVKAAAAVLSRSRGVDSGKSLLALISYFPPQGEPRAAAIMALDARRQELSIWLKAETLPVVLSALRTESARWRTMLPLIRLAVALGPESIPSLARLLKHDDAEVLAETAEALVTFKHVESIPALESIVAGALNDPRFSPRDGRPDPAAMLARIEKAVDRLRRLN